MSILIDNKRVNFSKTDFPMLIHGAEKTGTSFFSICLLAELLKKGMKVALFSAYPMAKEEFRKQIVGYESKAIIIDSGDEGTLIEALQDITDLNERVVLIKNIEHYSLNLFKAVKDLRLIIFSGDLDKCDFVDSLMTLSFSSQILFSSSKKYPQHDLTSLPKYRGKIIGDNYNGLISLGLEE
jgi:hypothetical protein